MDQFKIENFCKSHPAASFPYFKQIDAEECSVIAKRFAVAVGLSDSADSLTLARRIAEVESDVGTLNELNPQSSLTQLLEKAKIPFSEFVYVNWNRFDSVDLMKFSDLVNYIDDIWYPSSDDIDIFDVTCSWIVSITHYRSVRAARFQMPEHVGE